MKQMKKLLAVLLAVVMMASFVTVAVSADEPAATPLFTWEKGFSSSGFTYWGGFPSTEGGETKALDDYYTPIGAQSFFYNGPVSGWQALHFGFWDSTLSTLDLSVYDGICFYVNISSEHKFDLPGIRLTATAMVDDKDNPGQQKAVGFTFMGGIQTLERDKDVFIYIPWSDFTNDQQEAYGKVELKKEYITNMKGAQIQIYSGKWNESPSYKPTLKFTISDIYGYKTNGSDDVDEYTFEIPHDPSVKNLPGYFADRIVHEDVVAAVKAAYDAAEAKLAAITASTAKAEDIEVLQAFLDAYDNANTGTKEALAKVHNITKDAQADNDSWYRIDAMRQEWADDLAWREGQANNGSDVDVKAAKPAKVKGVKVKVAKKKVTVTWKKAKNAKKYVVKYSYKKNMKKAKTLKVKKTKAVIKKLKSGKKVYIQVQGVNGKVKGKFSKKVAKKVK